VAGSTLPQILATSLIMLMIPIPCLTFKELNEVLGEGRLQQLVFAHRTGLRSDSAQERGQG
jgi:hypothetical protein